MFQRSYWRQWLRSKFGRALVSTSPTLPRGQKLYAFSPTSYFAWTKKKWLVLPVGIILVYLVVHAMLPSASWDPLNEKCIEFIGTHNGSLQGYAPSQFLFQILRYRCVPDRLLFAGFPLVSTAVTLHQGKACKDTVSAAATSRS